MRCYWNIKQNMMINSLWWISQFHYFLEFLLISWHSVTKFLNEYVIPNVHFIFKSRIYSSLPVKFVSLLPFHVSVNTPTSYLVEKQRRENSQILFFGLNHMFTQPSHVHPAVTCFRKVVQDLLVAHWGYSYDSFISLPCCVACGILVPWPGIEPVALALEALCLNHWITRGVLRSLLHLICFLYYYLSSAWNPLWFSLFPAEPALSDLA